VRVESDTDSVVVTVDGCSCELSRADATQLQEAIGDALTERREFFRTAGEHREDGSYVVERRGADSAGNAKVFESFEHLRRLYDRMPDGFDAEDVATGGITGSRRHMLVRHFAEHPSFDCTIASRNPLAVEKAGGDAGEQGDELEVQAD
jgi:hypothetical protein